MTPDGGGGAPRTLAELLIARASEQRSTAPAIRFVHDATETDVSAADMLARAERVATRLRAHGVAPGDRVMLMLSVQQDVVDAFFGAVWAGAVPVPLFPPVFAQRLEDFLARFTSIAKNARARALLVSAEIVEPARALAASLKSAAGLELDVLGPADWRPLPGESPTDAAPVAPPSARPSDVAFLQYTSGSTDLPKGVVLTHENVMHNVRAICAATRFGPDDVGVSWLPLYHDMGLVGGLLSTLYSRARLVSLSPLSFARRPIEWLRAITRERGTLSPAPNFAYRRCLSIPDDQLEGLDLSTWRIAFNGAEPIDARTLERFSRRFAPHGFRERAMFPVYGLAEHTLAVTFPALDSLPRIEHVDRASLTALGVALPIAANEATEIAFVGVGAPLADVTIEIRRDGTLLPDGEVGEVFVKSPSVMGGYFESPAATATALVNGWLATGDLGYRRDGQLFITGRRKDLVIVAGRNYVPQDLEAAAHEVAGVRAGRVVAFAVATDDGERAVLVVEPAAEPDAGAKQRIEADVTHAVAARTGLHPARVVVINRGTLPVTSSGKVQRAETRARYLAGAYDPEAMSPQTRTAQS